jgi:hypothetical protein
MKKLFVVALILWVVTLTAGAAGAEVIATRVRTNDLIVPVDVCPGAGCPLVPLNNSATGTSMNFVTTVDNERIVIIYNAECTVTANSTTTWLALTILVDGNAVTPSGTDKAHCTSNNNGSNWVSAVATAVVVVAEPGIHNVRIQAQILNGVAGNTARLDDSTIVVMK